MAKGYPEAFRASGCPLPGMRTTGPTRLDETRCDKGAILRAAWVYAAEGLQARRTRPAQLVSWGARVQWNGDPCRATGPGPSYFISYTNCKVNRFPRDSSANINPPGAPPTIAEVNCPPVLLGCHRQRAEKVPEGRLAFGFKIVLSPVGLLEGDWRSVTLGTSGARSLHSADTIPQI